MKRTIFATHYPETKEPIASVDSHHLGGRGGREWREGGEEGREGGREGGREREGSELQSDACPRITQKQNIQVPTRDWRGKRI